MTKPDLAALSELLEKAAAVEADAQCRRLATEVTRLRSLVDEAAGALEPFSEAGVIFQNRELFPDNHPICTHEGLTVQYLARDGKVTAVCMADFRAAASFLTRLRAQPNTAKPAMGREPEGEG